VTVKLTSRNVENLLVGSDDMLLSDAVVDFSAALTCKRDKWVWPPALRIAEKLLAKSRNSKPVLIGCWSQRANSGNSEESSAVAAVDLENDSDREGAHPHAYRRQTSQT